MTTRGRRTKPTHMKIVAGSRERDINRNEPAPATGEVDMTEPPRGCGAKVAKVWRRLAKDLVDKHVLTPWDGGLFLQYCRLEVHADELSRKITRPPADHGFVDGYVTVGSQGQLVQSPYYRQYLQAVAELRNLAGHFGLSPSARAGIVVGGVGAGDRPTMGGERLLS